MSINFIILYRTDNYSFKTHNYASGTSAKNVIKTASQSSLQSVVIIPQGILGFFSGFGQAQ